MTEQRYSDGHFNRLWVPARHIWLVVVRMVDTVFAKEVLFYPNLVDLKW